jgi:hypothetical protein
MMMEENGGPELEATLKMRLYDLERRRYLNARWWRNLNRWMNPLGLVIITIIVCPVTLVSRIILISLDHTGYCGNHSGLLESPCIPITLRPFSGPLYPDQLFLILSAVNACFCSTGLASSFIFLSPQSDYLIPYPQPTITLSLLSSDFLRLTFSLLYSHTSPRFSWLLFLFLHKRKILSTRPHDVMHIMFYTHSLHTRRYSCFCSPFPIILMAGISTWSKGNRFPPRAFYDDRSRT